MKKLVVVLTNVDTSEVLERWQFDVECEEETTAEEKENSGSDNAKSKTAEKDVAKIKQEIRDVIRQITASVTFLPLLDCLCSFDVLIYTPE